MKQLEFDKIIDGLKAYGKSSLGVIAIGRIKPYQNMEQAQQELELVKDTVAARIKLGNSPVLPFDDVTDSLKKAIIGSTLGIPEIMRVGNLLHCSYTAKKNLSGEDIPGGIFAIAEEITLDETLQKEIKQNFISEEEVADSASIALASIRKKMRSSHDKIRSKLNGMIASTSFQKYLQDPIVTMRDNKYVVPVKSEHRGSVPGVLHDQSSSGATVFIEPMAVVEINNELTRLMIEEREEIERILESYSGEIGAIGEALMENLKILTRLDVLFAKAAYATDNRATMPHLHAGGRVWIKEARHPLIDRNKVVPIDILLEDDIRCLLITGPNTGGKTVTLKTLGLFALMAKSGLFINAKEGSELPFFTDVLVDIGDEQSIEQNLSTFSGHITNIIKIIHTIQDGSLCLLDELGAGTDPVEGAALATAIIDTLMKKNIKIVATTHYAELKAYAMQHPAIENASMEFDVDSLSPTYRMITGLAGKSNAFLIARKLGLGEDVIQDAKERVEEKDIAFEEVISSAESYRQRALKDKERADKLKWENQSLNTKMQQLLDKQESEYRRIMDKAKSDARRIVESAQDEAKEVVKEIRAMKTQLDAQQERKIQSGTEKLRLQLDKNATKLNDDKPAAQLTKIEIGQEVNLLGTGRAVVMSLPDSKGQMMVQAGPMKFKVHRDQLGAVPKKKAPKATTKRSIAVKQISPEIKLLGMTVDDASIELDRFLDDAALSGLEEVRVVHGKGTGALRRGIQSFLKTNPHVKEFRLGSFGEGEDGVTIVTLK